MFYQEKATTRGAMFSLQWHGCCSLLYVFIYWFGAVIIHIEHDARKERIVTGLEQ
jgi:hypothetical protein